MTSQTCGLKTGEQLAPLFFLKNYLTDLEYRSIIIMSVKEKGNAMNNAIYVVSSYIEGCEILFETEGVYLAKDEAKQETAKCFNRLTSSYVDADYISVMMNTWIFNNESKRYEWDYTQDYTLTL